MSRTYDVIVIGVGSMGASTCYQLAKRGVHVLGLEQFDIPHNFGAHHGQTRMIRLAYFEHPDYVPLLLRSYELWNELEAATGQGLLHKTGGLYMGPADSKLIAGALEACKRHNLPYELLNRESFETQFGQHELPDDFQIFYENQAGFLLPETAVAANAQQALVHGAQLRGREGVKNWSTTTRGVTVNTDKDTYHAQHVVITAGAWTSKLAADMGIPLNVTRQVQAWFAPKQRDLFEMGTLPVWFYEVSGGHGFYGFPILPATPGLKVALHKPDTSTDPDAVNRNITDADISEIESFMADHLPSATGGLLSASVCLYTNSPDSHFVIDRHPEFENVSVACGFSGHGFKFSTVIGEALADLASESKTELPIGFLAARRFSS